MHLTMSEKIANAIKESDERFTVGVLTLNNGQETVMVGTPDGSFYSIKVERYYPAPF